MHVHVGARRPKRTKCPECDQRRDVRKRMIEYYKDPYLMLNDYESLHKRTCSRYDMEIKPWRCNVCHDSVLLS